MQRQSTHVSSNNNQSLQRTFHRCFLPNCCSFGKVVSEEKFFQKSTKQKQEWPVAAMLVNGLGQNQQSLQRTFHISVHLGKRFQRRRFFRNQPIKNKNGLWWPCLLMDWSYMSNLYREPSKDASYQVSVHLAKRFHRRFLVQLEAHH